MSIPTAPSQRNGVSIPTFRDPEVPARLPVGVISAEWSEHSDCSTPTWFGPSVKVVLSQRNGVSIPTSSDAEVESEGFEGVISAEWSEHSDRRWRIGIRRLEDRCYLSGME